MAIAKIYNSGTAAWEPAIVGKEGPQGIQGIQGEVGPDGAGVPATGADDQVLTVVAGAPAWADAGGGGYNTLTEITASNATYDVSAISGVVKFTLVGGGGGGTGGYQGVTASSGGSTSVAGIGTAQGGLYGIATGTAQDEQYVIAGSNGGQRSLFEGNYTNYNKGNGGEMKFIFADLTGVSTINVTIGAGGTKGANSAASGIRV
jgi:hypothetical protein